MKKKLVFFVSLLCCCCLCYSQQIVSSGGSITKSEISINWVLGGDLITMSTSQNRLAPIESLMSLKVFPNPAVDFLNVEITPADTGQIILELYNSIGMKIFNQKFSLEPIIQIDVSDFPSGAYLLKAFSPSNEMFYSTKKIFK